MLRRAVAASALIALAVPAGARAQDLEALCRKAQRPPVGAWSEFRMVGGRDDGATIRMSVVGSERREGTDYLWMEMVMHGFPMAAEERQGGPRTAPRVISKLLVPGLGPASGGPRATIFKIGDNPAMELPASQSRMTPRQGPNLEACRDAKVIGWESVTVPAGTFRAIHVVASSGRGDTWVVPDLPFAVVKEAGHQESQMVLVAHGRGARTQITERPRPWNPQAFMQMMTGRGAPAPRH